jgi:hypothetical protein
MNINPDFIFIIILSSFINSLLTFNSDCLSVYILSLIYFDRVFLLFSALSLDYF